MLQRVVQLAEEIAKWEEAEEKERQRLEGLRASGALGGAASTAERPLMIRTGKAKTEGALMADGAAGAGTAAADGRAGGCCLCGLLAECMAGWCRDETEARPIPQALTFPCCIALPRPAPSAPPPCRRDPHLPQGDWQAALPWGARRRQLGRRGLGGADCPVPLGLPVLGVPAGGGPAVLRGERASPAVPRQLLVVHHTALLLLHLAPFALPELCLPCQLAAPPHPAAACAPPPACLPACLPACRSTPTRAA